MEEQSTIFEIMDVAELHYNECKFGYYSDQSSQVASTYVELMELPL